MKINFLVPLIIATTVLIGCYTTEDAIDVNQERIKAHYCTEFNATRKTTKISN